MTFKQQYKNHIIRATAQLVLSILSLTNPVVLMILGVPLSTISYLSIGLSIFNLVFSILHYRKAQKVKGYIVFDNFLNDKA